MSDRNHRLAPVAQVGKQFVVKDVPKSRVLFGGPFIKDENGAIFDQHGDQSQTLSLPGREFAGRKCAVFKPDFLGQSHPVNPLIDLHWICVFIAIQAFKQVKVAHYQRKHTAQTGDSIGTNLFAVQPHACACRSVKPRHRFDKGGFSSSVAADDIDQLAGLYRQIHRTKLEAAAAVGVGIGVVQSAQLQFIEPIRWEQGGLFVFCKLVQLGFQRMKALERRSGAVDHRDDVKKPRQIADQEQHDRGDFQNLDRIDAVKARDQKHHRRDDPVKDGLDHHPCLYVVARGLGDQFAVDHHQIVIGAVDCAEPFRVQFHFHETAQGFGHGVRQIPFGCYDAVHPGAGLLAVALAVKGGPAQTCGDGQKGGWREIKKVYRAENQHEHGLQAVNDHVRCLHHLTDVARA